jgi:hypothetical protein
MHLYAHHFAQLKMCRLDSYSNICRVLISVHHTLINKMQNEDINASHCYDHHQ